MNILMLNIIILITLSTGVTVFASNTPPVSLIKSTSLVNGTTCPQATVLYRGISGNFFPVESALRNMIGDPLAELPSWRLSTIYNSLKNKGISEDIAWKNAKKIAAKELNLLNTKQRFVI